MVGQRRFGPLIAAVLIGLGVLVARLFQVSVGEHEVWAREAANLVRSSTVLPYHRGRIRDQQGHVLARDEEVYEIELVYRTFRRGNALGQVAHARSLIEQRAVPLDEAFAYLVPWANELVDLSPAALRAFARGEALRVGEGVLPATDDPRRERRSRRAADLSFYVTQLLHMTPRELGTLRELRQGPKGELSFLELAASMRKGVGPAELREELEEDLQATRRHLQFLAVRLDLLEEHSGITEDLAYATGDASLDLLLSDLEGARRSVEDDAASDLFRRAAGFTAGRVETQTLLSVFDLEWIARHLAWDGARLYEWAGAQRDAWLSWRDSVAVPTSLTRLELYGADEVPDRLLTELSRVVAAPRARRLLRPRDHDWRDVTELAVLREVPTLFDVPEGVDPAAETEPAVLPFQDGLLRQLGSKEIGWDVLGHCYLPSDAPSVLPVEALFDHDSVEEVEAAWANPDSIAAYLGLLFGRPAGLRSEAARYAAVRVLEGWEERLQEAVREALEPTRDAWPLAFRPDRIDSATERAQYILRDRGSRPIGMRRDPSYEVVQLVTRYPERYRGFAVRDARRRVYPLLRPDGEPVASFLLGHVRESNLREVLGQRGEERRAHELQRMTKRTPEQQEELERLTARLFRPDESHGGSGVESYFDDELRGQNGYREIEGMQEREERGSSSRYRPPVDGKELVLTLDVGIQAAALECLLNPEHEPSDPRRDDEWLLYPVGAIVLATPRGEVLAAASAPTQDRQALLGRDGEREIARERTMRRATFQPPGSVFKPFIAAWCLENKGLTEHTTYVCEHQEHLNYSGYKRLRCNKMWGHHEVDLDKALSQSCNVYFAHLGEQLTREELVEVAALFGFSEPTGVRSFGSGRPGLVEDVRQNGLTEEEFKGRSPSEQAALRRRVANGLNKIEATPMQVCRATCGLATGELPDMLLVDTIGGEPLPRRARKLPISARHMELVRRGMRLAVTTVGGTGHDKGLSEEEVGYTVALKTGSADYLPVPGEEDRVSKHTWVTGWIPADEPALVFTVYLHDTIETASHSAIYVARQVLKRPEVQAYLEAAVGAEADEEEQR